MFFAGLAVMLLGTWPLKVCWLGTSWESGWERRLLAQKRRKQALKEAVWGVRFNFSFVANSAKHLL